MPRLCIIPMAAIVWMILLLAGELLQLFPFLS